MKFELAAKITPMGKTVSKAKLVTANKKYIVKSWIKTPVEPTKAKLTALLGTILPIKVWRSEIIKSQSLIYL